MKPGEFNPCMTGWSASYIYHEKGITMEWISLGHILIIRHPISQMKIYLKLLYFWQKIKYQQNEKINLFALY